jgi:phosphoribosylanthranilate isomerase
LIDSIRDEQPEARFIGVFVDEPAEEIAGTAQLLDLFAVQVHGEVPRLDDLLPPAQIIPAMGIKCETDGARLAAMSTDYGAVLADAFAEDKAGGTGKVFDHRIVQPFFERRRMFLAGGLKPENIEQVVARLSPGPFPYVFDLSSGLEERPGWKSEAKMRDFFARYRACFGKAPGQ